MSGVGGGCCCCSGGGGSGGGLEDWRERERVEIEFLLGGVECVGLALFYWASPLSSTIGGLRESGAGQAVQGKEGWGGGGTWR